MGARGPFLQHRESRGIELVDHIAHGLVVAAQQPSNRRGSFHARRCSQDLAATHHKGIGRTQSRLDLVLFVLGERSDKNGCSHTSYCTTLPTTSGGIALVPLRSVVSTRRSPSNLTPGDSVGFRTTGAFCTWMGYILASVMGRKPTPRSF